MTTTGITHQFGPWSPMRFIPLTFREDAAPAFWVTTTRICRGAHDFRCAQAQTQTFGPLVLEGATTADLWTCPNCHRTQPPVDTGATGQAPLCLFCTDMATVQHTGDQADTTASVSAAAALHGASATLRQAKAADPTGYLALLEDTGDALRSLLDDAAWAVKQEPPRARQSGYRALVMVARQILANAKEYAQLNFQPKEPFPTKDTDD